MTFVWGIFPARGVEIRRAVALERSAERVAFIVTTACLIIPPARPVRLHHYHGRVLLQLTMTDRIMRSRKTPLLALDTSLSVSSAHSHRKLASTDREQAIDGEGLHMRARRNDLSDIKSARREFRIRDRLRSDGVFEIALRRMCDGRGVHWGGIR